MYGTFKCKGVKLEGGTKYCQLGLQMLPPAEFYIKIF